MEYNGTRKRAAVCPECGARNPGGNAYCGLCGARLARTKRPQTQGAPVPSRTGRSNERVPEQREKQSVRRQGESKKRKRALARRRKRIALACVAGAVILALCAALLWWIFGGRKNKQAYKVGDLVPIGTFDLDGDASNGREPVIWRVLAEEDDGSCLMTAQDGIDVPSYVAKDEDSILGWLNDDFYNYTFPDADRNRIVKEPSKHKRTKPAADNPPQREYVTILTPEDEQDYPEIRDLLPDEPQPDRVWPVIVVRPDDSEETPRPTAPAKETDALPGVTPNPEESAGDAQSPGADVQETGTDAPGTVPQQPQTETPSQPETTENGRGAGITAKRWDDETTEKVIAQLVCHYMREAHPEGQYVIYSGEINETDTTAKLVMRYRMSEAEAKERMDRGAPVANVYVTEITVNKADGHVTIENYGDAWYGDSWYLDDDSKWDVLDIAALYPYETVSQTDRNPNHYMAHNFYCDPVTGSNAITAFSIDFRIQEDPDYTYWSLCSPQLDHSMVPGTDKRTVKENTGGMYGGIQTVGDYGKLVIGSVWDYDYTDPDGKEQRIEANLISGQDIVNNRFGGEGTGARCRTQYNWKAGVWYRYLERIVETGGRSVREDWLQEKGTGRWTLISRYDLGVSGTSMNRTNQFMENFSSSTYDAVRTLQLSNIYVMEKGSAKWKAVETAKLSVDTTYNNKKGGFAFGAAENYFWGITCGIGEDAAKNGNTVTEKTFTIKNFDSAPDLMSLPGNGGAYSDPEDAATEPVPQQPAPVPQQPVSDEQPEPREPAGKPVFVPDWENGRYDRTEPRDDGTIADGMVWWARNSGISGDTISAEIGAERSAGKLSGYKDKYFEYYEEIVEYPEASGSIVSAKKDGNKIALTYRTETVGTKVKIRIPKNATVRVFLPVKLTIDPECSYFADMYVIDSAEKPHRIEKDTFLDHYRKEPGSAVCMYIQDGRVISMMIPYHP